VVCGNVMVYSRQRYGLSHRKRVGMFRIVRSGNSCSSCGNNLLLVFFFGGSCTNFARTGLGAPFRSTITRSLTIFEVVARPVHDLSRDGSLAPPPTLLQTPEVQFGGQLRKTHYNNPEPGGRIRCDSDQGSALRRVSGENLAHSPRDGRESRMEKRCVRSKRLRRPARSHLCVATRRLPGRNRRARRGYGICRRSVQRNFDRARQSD
jgi:hypothetical protein